jgi:hypothetical protein
LLYGTVAAVLVLSLISLSLPRKFPSIAWLGSRSRWLSAHPWLAVLASTFALCHAGFSLGGIVETSLVVAFCLTFLSGCAGAVIQHLLPRLLTMRVPFDIPHERIPDLCRLLRRKADSVVQEVWNLAEEDSHQSMAASQFGLGARRQLHKFFESELRPFLAIHPPQENWLRDPLHAKSAFDSLRALPGLASIKEQVNILEQLANERRALLTQESLYAWLHGWTLIHVPLAVATAALTIFHAVIALYYRA